MQKNEDPQAFVEAYMDTPFQGPDFHRIAADAEHPDDIIMVPGVCLKSKERAKKGWPMYTGILVSADKKENKVTVRSHNLNVVDGEKAKPCVWTGTVQQYVEMWIVD